MLSADYSGIWRNGHSATYDVTNLHVSRFLWFTSYRARIDLSTGLSIFNIDCIPTKLIEKNTISFWCKIGAKTCTGQNTRTWSWSPFQGQFHWFRSKLFRPVEGVHRVKDRENKKAEKNEKERSKEKNRKVQQNKNKKWLMRMRESKIWYIFTWKFHQNLPTLSETAFLANLENVWIVEPRKLFNG